MRAFGGSLSIRSRIITSFSCIAIISILAVGLFSTLKSVRAMIDKEVVDSKRNLEFIDYKINDLMEEKHLGSLRLAYNDAVISYLKGNTVSVESKDENETRRQMLSYFKAEGLTSIKLVDNDGNVLFYSPTFYSSFKTSTDSSLIPDNLDEYYMFDRWGDATWDGREAVIPYTRIIIDSKRDNHIGYLIVNVKESVFNRAYQNYEDGSGTSYYVINGNDIIQSCSDKNLFGGKAGELLGIGVESLGSDEAYFNIKNKDGRFIITSYRDRRNDLYVMAMTPMSVVTGDAVSIVIITFIIAIICALACIYTSIAVSKSVAEPLNQLIDRISVRGYEHADKKNTADEMEILNLQYEGLLAELEKTIDQYYAEQRVKRYAEIRALEFQINPHFLYNTLSTVIWLIDEGESRQAIDIIKKLSAFYRLSTSHGNKYITVCDELKHVDIYTDIQNARYAGRISFRKEVPEQLYSFCIPRLILQPLVENSIIHALQERDDGLGMILITGREEEDCMYLEVRDNGDTITEEDIDEMNAFLHDIENRDPEGEYGIGIANVNDRIRMSFGEEYGLSYRREDEMTVASLRLKKMRSEDIWPITA